MKKNKLIFPILFVLYLSSCSNTHEIVISNEIQNAFIINSSSTFKGYYYQGTDNEFHYFVSKWNFEKDKYFKLKKEDLNVNTPYELGTEELKIDLLKTDDKFGSNIFYELYLVE